MAPKKRCVLFLLDWKPVYWSTREEYFFQISRRLSEREIVPILVVSEEAAANVRERFAQAGARLTVCSYHSRPLQYWALLRRTAREFTVLFAHVRFFDYFTALFWMSRLSGIRAILFTEANSGEWRKTGWKRLPVRLRTWLMCAPVSQFIAISEFIRRRLEAVGLPPEKIAVVYNGVDLASFQRNAEARTELRKKTGVGADTLVLIFMSVLLEWKRPEIALRVCAELARRGLDVELWMAGTGPLQASLEALAKQLGVESRVRWLGYQPDPHRWLASADVFLHTALGEAFGNVLVEALGCGLPVVASESGATPELIEKDRTGMLAPPGPQEVERLADAVQTVAGNRVRYAEFSRAAAESAQRFSTEIAVERTLRVYEKWLGQN